MSPTSSHTPSALPTAARAGLVTALATWALVVLPALVGWVSAPESSLGWWAGVAVGSAIWFLGHGQAIGGPGIAVSTTPLLLLAVFVAIAWRMSRRLVLGARPAVRRAEWDTVVWRGLVPGYLLGYAVAAAVFGALTLAGSVHPDPIGIAGTMLVPVVGLAVVLVRPGADTTPALVERGLAALPRWSVAAWRAACRGAVLLLGAGMVLVVLSMLVALGDVLRIQGEYDAGLVAGAVLAIAQVAFLGNVATWGLAFLVGPGFSVAVDGLVSPAGAHPGLMPLIPILGALPDEAAYPRIVWVVLVVPVVIGAMVARRTDLLLGSAGRRERASAVGAACATAVALVTVLTALANGAMGLERLGSVGVQIWPLAGCLLAELLVGAAVWLAVAFYRERTASGDPARAGTSSRSAGLKVPADRS
ncbi:MAG: DUF6350 family protein [Intrasporangium sp.]|uniref:cell division protein PerM n=1 Tax=Intrasporangium sp. TaxID=1925024 RepID=UPI0026482077|nr:DUF6350 family protein [Intrasporangium sp.]MDN5794532.1 DUF6350 family protein [Intrasporangium sp.]